MTNAIGMYVLLVEYWLLRLIGLIQINYYGSLDLGTSFGLIFCHVMTSSYRLLSFIYIEILLVVLHISFFHYSHMLAFLLAYLMRWSCDIFRNDNGDFGVYVCQVVKSFRPLLLSLHIILIRILWCIYSQYNMWEVGAFIHVLWFHISMECISKNI